jgi:predicted  nucleic acid-binding Zn-ribbon protein
MRILKGKSRWRTTQFDCPECGGRAYSYVPAMDKTEDGIRLYATLPCGHQFDRVETVDEKGRTWIWPGKSA